MQISKTSGRAGKKVKRTENWAPKKVLFRRPKGRKRPAITKKVKFQKWNALKHSQR